MPNVDLQAVSISPRKPRIRKGTQTTIEVVMKNNGPDTIPTGEATCHITVPGDILLKPSGFKPMGKQWALQVIKPQDGRYEMYFKNTAGPIPVDNTNMYGFKFIVKGRKKGVCTITLASSLSGTATSGDVDGANQSVSTEMIVE